MPESRPNEIEIIGKKKQLSRDAVALFRFPVIRYFPLQDKKRRLHDFVVPTSEDRRWYFFGILEADLREWERGRWGKVVRQKGEGSPYVAPYKEKKK